MRSAVTGLALSSSLLVCACTSIASVPAGPIKLAEGHTATLEQPWADVSPLIPQRQKEVRVLTIDGPALNRLYLVGGLPDGKGLMRPVSKEKRVPTFHKGMSPTELVEFVTESVAALGYLRVESEALRPASYRGKDALRLDLSAVTDGGLEVSGTAEVVEIDAKLYAILFLAPREHYFARTLPTVDALLKSAS